MQARARTAAWPPTRITAPDDVHGHEHHRHAREVLHVADGGLARRARTSSTLPRRRTTAGAPARCSSHMRREHRDEEEILGDAVDASDVVNDEVEPAHVLVAPVRPGARDDRAGREHERGGRDQRARPIVRDLGRDERSAGDAVGSPARWCRTTASATSTIDTRKWAITQRRRQIRRCTVSPPRTIWATTPTTRPTESHVRSRRRGARTSDPSTARITSTDTSPVNSRFTNSTAPW